MDGLLLVVFIVAGLVALGGWVVGVGWFMSCAWEDDDKESNSAAGIGGLCLLAGGGAMALIACFHHPGGIIIAAIVFGVIAILSFLGLASMA
jgi:hypothetical protein